MGSHFDNDHASKELEKLKIRAEVMSDLAKNRVATDNPLESWRHSGIHVQRLADDMQGVLRVSIGSAPGGLGAYCNFRGDQGQVIALLEDCVKAMKSQ